MHEFTIRKYTIRHFGGDVQVLMPTGSTILNVWGGGDAVNFWAKVQVDAVHVTRTFRVFRTRDIIPDARNQHYEYRGSTHLGPSPWHLFERLEDWEVCSEG